MKQRLIILLISLLILDLSYSQSTCLTQGILFSSQFQVDNFQANYPGCSQIAGNVTISGADITNLNGLSILTLIEGTFWIHSNPLLPDLSGLDNLLTIVGSLYINSDSSLVNFEGLNSLMSIGGALYIADNESITSLSGLDDLSLIETDLTISNNPLLTDLSSLIGLEEITGQLTIQDNGSLLQLSGLNNIQQVTESVTIRDNYALNNMAGLNSLNSIGGNFLIEWDTAMVSLTGLESLDSIGGDLWISWDHGLTNMTGLNQLKYIGNHFYIWYNKGLADLTGLESLTSCYTFDLLMDTTLVSLHGVENLTNIEYDLSIWNIWKLTSVSALKNVNSSPRFIYIYGIRKLESLDGLDNFVDTALVRLQIESNHMLSDCAVASICHYLSVQGGLTDIGDNEPGCNSEAEILEACETLSVEQSAVGGQRSAVMVFPNPADNQLIIELSRFSSCKNTIAEIYTIDGQLILKQKLVEPLIVIDIQWIAPGVYYIKVVDDGSVFFTKFIKR